MNLRNPSVTDGRPMWGQVRRSCRPRASMAWGPGRSAGNHKALISAWLGRGVTPPAFSGGSSAPSPGPGVSRPMLPARTALAPRPQPKLCPGGSLRSPPSLKGYVGVSMEIFFHWIDTHTPSPSLFSLLAFSSHASRIFLLTLTLFFLTVREETDKMGKAMKFIVDRTVGKLGKYLRMLGFDVIYDPGGSREEMAARASNEERVILTRSRKNLGKGDPRGIRWVGSDNPRDQLAEVLGHFRLKPGANRFFSRCLFCNEELLPLAKERAEGKVPDFIYQAYDSFHLCPRCQRIY